MDDLITSFILLKISYRRVDTLLKFLTKMYVFLSNFFLQKARYFAQNFLQKARYFSQNILQKARYCYTGSPRDIGKPLRRQTWPLEGVSHHQVVQKRRVLLPYLVLLVDDSFLHGVVESTWCRNGKLNNIEQNIISFYN